MARKKDTYERPGVVGRFLRALATRILRPILERRPRERAAPPPPPERERPEPEIVPIEATEAHGAARDERSFEQRRRGGPMTGEAPIESLGPHHAGGGRRRGRDASAEIVDEFKAPPILDYDQLSEEQVAERIASLRPDEVRWVLRYEVATKHRKMVVELLEARLRRLAA